MSQDAYELSAMALLLMSVLSLLQRSVYTTTRCFKVASLHVIVIRVANDAQLNNRLFARI
jgi:hypothetical protein